MSASSSAYTSLRLVRPDEDVDSRPPGREAGTPARLARDAAQPRPVPRAVTGSERIEQHSAPTVTLSALDPRWVLAVEVRRQMQGGRASIITPDTRRRLMLVGRRLGLRPFDTSLVIAIIQDAGRRGEDPLGPMSVSRLRLVREAPLADAAPVLTWSRVAAMVIAAGLFGAALTLVLLRVLE
ncbi:MAG TPA: hypothetical protein VHC70_10065 [Phycisphaerales bacterium]|nr:hypothetical protein [Phycisphaerales bacterium]